MIRYFINRINFCLLRYFSTALSSLRYILETRSEDIRNSDSRGCGRFISLRTVTEKSLDAAHSYPAYARMKNEYGI